MYALRKAFEINYPQKELNIQLDESYQIFQEFEARHFAGAPVQRQFSDLYKFTEKKKLIKTIFNNSSKTRSFTPSQSESNVFDDHVFYSALTPILKVEASQLEELQCYLPVFSSIEKISSFYDKNWPKLKELFIK